MIKSKANETYTGEEGGIYLWCKKCNKETDDKICSTCGMKTQEDISVEVYWCGECKVPIIREANSLTKHQCPLCKGASNYLCADLRPVFPEERLLLEILRNKPLHYINNSVWAADSRYYIDGNPKMLSRAVMQSANIFKVREQLAQYKEENNYEKFNIDVERFIEANKERLDLLKTEASTFVRETVNSYPNEQPVVSFSGGKDSSVTSDLVMRALGNPRVTHIFGNTTLEFPLTMTYVERFRKDNHITVFRTAINTEQNFYSVCEDIGPPSRVMRWCCTMFKTGPITKRINAMFRDKSILTFYGIRKCESVSRSKYNRIEKDSENVKIRKQRVASPVFYWKDIDIWLYLLAEKLDFNDAYRLGYDRVGCWCCPNNSERSQLLAKIYMPEQAEKWRTFLVDFAKRIGKPDAEVYIDSGNWKARQGGNGLEAAQDIKIAYTNCTVEDNAKIYRINKPIDKDFYTLFIPFGIVSTELGRKLIGEVLVLDKKTKMPILAITPHKADGYNYAVKIKTLNVKNHEDLQRMVSYQIRKFNACRKCLKCESVCKHRAISINKGEYRISAEKCKQCKMCITAKYLEGGCFMYGYLKQREDYDEHKN